MTNDALQHIRMAWIPDGSGLVCVAEEPNHPSRSYRIDLTGKTSAITPEGTAGIFVTPDSKYLVATDAQSRRFMYPLAGGDPKPFPIDLKENERIVKFEPDGKSILISQPGVPARIFRVFLDGGRREEILDITPPDPAGVLNVLDARFSADNKAYAYSYFRVLSDLWVVDYLK